MLAIERDEADIMTVEAGNMFTAGRWHGLVPIAMEEYSGTSVKNAVVIAQKTAEIKSLQDLQGKRLCSPGAGTMAGWILPISRLLRQSTSFQENSQSPESLKLNIIDCNNAYQTLSSFFGPSCVPGTLDSRHNQRSDNPTNLCQTCGPHRDTDTWCSSSDPYAGTDGVLNCMVHAAGEVAFLSADVALKLPAQTAERFEFVCPDGSTTPLMPLTVCSWGTFLADAFVVDSSKTEVEKIFLQRFVFNLTQTALRIFSDRMPVTNEKRYNGSDLLWSDAVTNIRLLSEPERRLQKLLGPDLYAAAQGDTACPYPGMRFCVVGREELDKCTALRAALESRNLKPPLICTLGRNHWDCMKLIADDLADVMVADAADSYLAEKLYGLTPFMAEIYDQPEPFLYAVAVARRKDPVTSLLDLRGRRTCHGSIYSAVGWSVPISFLVTQNRVREAKDCDDLTYQVSQIFQKACAPGALVTAHYRSVLHPENLCDLCMGDIESYCAREPGEPYYGSTGAFKCLAEGGGHVAFVTHLTPWENTDGRNMRMWARALVSQDFELLCVDGTRAPLSDFEKCNLGKVPANVIMSRKATSEETVDAWAVLFDYAQEAFGSPSSRDFRMFQSESHLNQDLMFRDMTTRLVRIAVENRSAEQYLGDEFVRVVLRAQCSSADHMGRTRVAYLTGGYDGEAAVNYQSAKTFKAHVNEERFVVYTIDIRTDGWYCQMDNGASVPINRSDFTLDMGDTVVKFEVIFIGIAGNPGEDGKLQAYFDLLKIPYTSCGAASSIVTFNKRFAVALAASNGILVAKSLHLFKDNAIDVADIGQRLRLPLFVKPCNGGSSIGVSKVSQWENLQSALATAFALDSEILLEEAISGREFTVGVYSHRGSAITLPITEVISMNEFFDFEAKYHGKSREDTPAQVDEDIAKNLEQQEPFMLEINTVPGQTSASILPQQIRAAGLTLREFYTDLIDAALTRP
ncbi:Melanotransferrin [Hypsibius exemplaris]|uniref:Melanotransferrin n=1 Tax=Hypsibius exemplaris TaxID=2072580 RepID=A0A1W0WT29_HYPEX|nr:Melanotransferrin [Hypsibius exemplaris]